MRPPLFAPKVRHSIARRYSLGIEAAPPPAALKGRDFRGLSQRGRLRVEHGGPRQPFGQVIAFNGPASADSRDASLSVGKRRTDARGRR
jgi:hypothetical protein